MEGKKSKKAEKNNEKLQKKIAKNNDDAFVTNWSQSNENKNTNTKVTRSRLKNNQNLLQQSQDNHEATYQEFIPSNEIINPNEQVLTGVSQENNINNYPEFLNKDANFIEPEKPNFDWFMPDYQSNLQQQQENHEATYQEFIPLNNATNPDKQIFTGVFQQNNLGVSDFTLAAQHDVNLSDKDGYSKIFDDVIQNDVIELFTHGDLKNKISKGSGRPKQEIISIDNKIIDHYKEERQFKNLTNKITKFVKSVKTKTDFLEKVFYLYTAVYDAKNKDKPLKRRVDIIKRFLLAIGYDLLTPEQKKAKDEANNLKSKQSQSKKLHVAENVIIQAKIDQNFTLAAQHDVNLSDKDGYSKIFDDVIQDDVIELFRQGDLKNKTSKGRGRGSGRPKEEIISIDNKIIDHYKEERQFKNLTNKITEFVKSVKTKTGFLEKVFYLYTAVYNAKNNSCKTKSVVVQRFMNVIGYDLLTPEQKKAKDEANNLKSMQSIQKKRAKLQAENHVNIKNIDQGNLVQGPRTEYTDEILPICGQVSIEQFNIDQAPGFDFNCELPIVNNHFGNDYGLDEEHEEGVNIDFEQSDIKEVANHVQEDINLWQNNFEKFNPYRDYYRRIRDPFDSSPSDDESKEDVVDVPTNNQTGIGNKKSLQKN